MFFFDYNSAYIAIIGDIKNSKQLESRNEVQNNLQNILKEINIKYEDDIASKFVITLGDEFQGLLSNGKNVMGIIEEIRRNLYPVEIRCGIGIGKMATTINPEMALGADGPAYYKAREAVEKLKENEKKSKTTAADIRLEWGEEKKDQESLINTVFELTCVIEKSWTDRQREIIWDMQKHDDGQTNAAKRLGIAQPTVQKALVKGHYYIYAKAMKDVNDILEDI